jgi:formate dehydrogenase maturation protein FdhE
VNSASSPTRTLASWVSLRLAVTHTFSSGTSDSRFCPICTSAPGSAFRLATTPELGARSVA